MTAMDYREEFFAFLDQYADFLARMAKDEEEKLRALMSNLLPRIEHAISVAQANAKQVENFELKRTRLQEQAGFGGMTFTEIIEAAPEEEQQSLDAVFRRIQSCVDEIKFHNSKSMRVAHTNMREIDPNAAIGTADDPGRTGASGAYMRAREKTRPDQISLLRTKI